MHSNKGFMQSQFQNQKYGEAWLRGFALVMKGLEKYGARIPFIPAGPIEIVWNFTYQCNLRCKHCYEDAGGKHPAELSTDQAKEVLDKLSKMASIGLPAISLSGGEPLTRKDFFEIASYAKKKIGYVSVASNGTLLTRENAEQLKKTGIDYIEISIDGPSPEIHDSFRGIPGAFDRSVQGVKNCVDAGIDTCIASVVHRGNLAEFEKLLSLAKQLGTRFMHFNYIPTGRAKSHVQLDLTPEERLKVLETMGKALTDLYVLKKEEELEKGYSNIAVDRYFSTCPQFASVTKEMSARQGDTFMVTAHYAAKQGVENVANFLGGCGCGRLYSCLEPNGDFKPCVFFPTNKDTVLGNILTDDFEEMWDNSPLLSQLRARDKLADCLVDGKRVGCAECPDKYICGGCRARSYSYFDGNVNMPDIGCIHNKRLWKSIIKNQ
jgi:radical SAM protein with 4Fe4S-binding SPASM domain